MVEVKQTDEEFVRGAWQLVHRCDGSYRAYPKGTVLVQGTHGSWQAFDSWFAAAVFTRDWQEQVRQLREEIETVNDMMDAGFDEVWSRILARLESILTDKLTGMKAGA